MLTSMKHVVIFDVKGDWSQLLVPKDESDNKNEKFTENCDVRVYTFGTGCGFPATLDPFVGEKLEIDGYDFDTKSWTSRDHQSLAEENVRVLVKDTLTAVGLIKTDLEKGVELANTMLPALANASGYHASGARDASDKQALATDLISVGWQTCLRIYYAKKALPKTFEEFAKGLKQVARELDENSSAESHAVHVPPALTSDDLYFVAKQIMAEVNGPWNVIYSKAKGKEGKQMPMHMKRMKQRIREA